jgi:hypothetical protein
VLSRATFDRAFISDTIKSYIEHKEGVSVRVRGQVFKGLIIVREHL